MAKSPAFQFYPKDFLADENVMAMELEELGAYIRLMCICWIEGSIPADVRRLARLCGCDSKRMAELWQAIEPCFEPHPTEEGRLIHPRLEREREKQAEHRAKKSEAGKEGAKKRWGNQDSTRHDDAMADATHDDGKCHSDAIAKNSFAVCSLQFATTGNPTSTPNPVAKATEAAPRSEDARANGRGNLEPSQPIDRKAVAATLAPIIREHLWLGDEPPRVSGSETWDMGRDLSIAFGFLDRGEVTLDELAGAITVARRTLGLSRDRPLTMRIFQVAGRRDRLNQCIAAWRKAERASGHIGVILGDLIGGVHVAAS